MKLSAVIITKNEEKNILRAIASVRFANEIIVIDAESTDQTVQLAQQAGARVIMHPWQGYGAQKNFGAQQARGEWLLFIDADEEVTLDLQEQIKAAISEPSIDFYWLRIVTVFLGKSLSHLYGHNPRLFRQRAGRWNDAHVHEQVERQDGQQIRLGDEHSRVLTAPLLHYSHTTIASYLQKMHHYTTLDAQRMADTKHHRSGRTVEPTWWLPWYLSVRQFIKLLLYRRGILDGWVGSMWCILSGYYEYEMARKYLRLK